MQLILYSKPGCHLCEGLEQKLTALPTLEVELEIRDITTREDWREAYQYEVPVLFQRVGEQEFQLPRPAPRLSAARLEPWLLKVMKS
ncbi:MAG: glutaredoxin family protein [Cyanobacteria bacterium P01_H01_bin.15]